MFINMIILNIFPNFDGIKETFALIWKRFAMWNSSMIDNFSTYLWLWSNAANYSGESVWGMVKHSFNISYIDYSVFITIWLITFFVIISILILMKWLWPVWNQITGWKKEMETKKGLWGIFSLFSTFLSKISKYVISFVFVIILTLLLTFVAKKIVDNGDYWIKTDKHISVLDNTPLIFNHFYWEIKPILFTNDSSNYKYMLENRTKLYGPIYINSKKYVTNWLFNDVYTPANVLAVNWGFNVESDYYYNNGHSYFDILTPSKLYYEKYHSENSNLRATALRANSDNTAWFNINIRLKKKGNIWNKETIGLYMWAQKSKILWEITNNKKPSLTTWKTTYVAVSFDLANINTIDTTDFKVKKAGGFLKWNISYIYEYKYTPWDNSWATNKLSELFICDTTGVDNFALYSNNKLSDKCIDFTLSDINNIKRPPFFIQSNKIIVNDFWSIISTLYLLKLGEKELNSTDFKWNTKNQSTEKSFIKDEIINNNIADLWIDTFPLQYSYRYGVNIITTDSSDVTLWLSDDKNQTNLMYKYTPSFILWLTYIEKITWKSALKMLPSVDSNDIKKYYNKYFLFAEWGSIADIYMTKNNNTLNNYLTLNIDQVINLVWAEWTWNKNVYKIWMTSTENSVTPLDIGIDSSNKLYKNALNFNNWNLHDNKLAPEQLDFLMKSMLTSSIYSYYDAISKWNALTYNNKTTDNTINGTSDKKTRPIVTNDYYNSYINTNKIYSYFYHFWNLVYKSVLIGYAKVLLYASFFILLFILWIIAIFKAVINIKWWKVKEKMGKTGEQLEKLSDKVGGSKITQIIFIMIGLSSFYLLYERAIIIFVFATLIWIFLIWRENKGEQEASTEKKSEENAEIKQSLESTDTKGKIKWAYLALKSKWKSAISKVVDGWKKTQSFLKNLWNILITVAANAYSFILISLLVYLIVTTLMVYFNGWQMLVFNGILWLYPDLFFLVFLITWMATIFSFQWRISNIISWFIVNQISWQNSFFNNFLQSHLDKSTFNKVTMWQNNITDAVVKNMKVWLNKIEEQTENEKLKRTLKWIKKYKNNITDHFDRWLAEKDGKMTLVSDLIEKWNLSTTVKMAQNLKKKISEMDLSGKIKEKTSQLKQWVISWTSISNMSDKLLSDEEINTLLLNNILDQWKRKEIYELLQAKWMDNEEIDKFIKWIETNIKNSYSVKIGAIEPSVKAIFKDSKKWIKWKSFYNINNSLFNTFDEEAKILWLDINNEDYINAKKITKKINNKGLNIWSMMKLLELFNGDRKSFNKALPFIDQFIEGDIDIAKLEEELMPIFEEMWLSDEQIQGILSNMEGFKNSIVKKNIVNIKWNNQKMFSLSWKGWYLSWFLYKQLYKWFNIDNATKIKEEKNNIIDTIKKEVHKRYPNWIPSEINDIIKKMEHTDWTIEFDKLINSLYTNHSIDKEVYETIKSAWPMKYLAWLNKVMTAMENNDYDGVGTELDNLSSILSEIDPDKNKKYIDWIDELKNTIKGFNIDKITWMDPHIKSLTIDTIINTKKWLLSSINKTKIPDEAKTTLNKIINDKLNNISPSVKEFYDWLITKDQLLWRLTKTTDLIEEKLKKYNIKWLKLSLEPNLMVDTLDKIKKEGINNIDTKEKAYLSQAKQFNALLLSDKENLSANLVWWVLEEIAWNKNLDDIQRWINKQEEKIEWIKVNNVNNYNVDLIENTTNQLVANKSKWIEEKIKELDKISKNGDSTEKQKEIAQKEKENLLGLKNSLEEEQKKIEESKSEWEKIELQKKTLKLKERNVKDEVERKQIQAEIKKEEEKLQQIQKWISRGLDSINNNLVTSDKQNDNVIQFLKQVSNETELKNISSDVIPAIQTLVDNEIKEEDSEETKEGKKLKQESLNAEIEWMLWSVIEWDKSEFLKKMLQIKNKYIPKDKSEEFDNLVLSKASKNIYNKPLSHLLNSQYIDDIIDMDNESIWKILESVETGWQPITDLIDKWLFKYLLENKEGDKVANNIELLNTISNKEKVLDQVGDILWINKELYNKDYKKDILENKNTPEIQKKKEYLLEDLTEKVEKEENKHKQKELKTILEDTKIIFNSNINTVTENMENIKEMEYLEWELHKKSNKIEKKLKKSKLRQLRLQEKKEKLRQEYELKTKIKKTDEAKEIKEKYQRLKDQELLSEHKVRQVQTELEKEKKEEEKVNKTLIEKKKDLFINNISPTNIKADIGNINKDSKPLNKTQEAVSSKSESSWSSITDRFSGNKQKEKLWVNGNNDKQKDLTKKNVFKDRITKTKVSDNIAKSNKL